MGSELRRLGNIDDAENLYLSLKEPLKDELILNDSNIDLARSGIELFISKRPSEVSIIVRGNPYVWNKASITYEEVVHLVFLMLIMLTRYILYCIQMDPEVIQVVL